MLKIELAKKRPHPFANKNAMFLRSAAPFVINKRGTLVHRPYSACVYNIHASPHIGVHFLCGMSVCDNRSRNNLTFTDYLDEGKLLCERCEEIAIKKRMPTTNQIVGRHVHTGRTKGVITCCAQKETA